MELVVDANVLLSCLLKEGTTRALLLDQRLHLFAPEYLISETSRHLCEDASLRKRIHLSNDELNILLSIFTQRIKTISADAYRPLMRQAIILAAHEEDAHYLALALLLRIPVWTNDQGFKKQGRVEIYTTTELFQRIGREN